MIKFSLSLIALTLSVVLTAQTKIDPTLEVRRDFDGRVQEFSKSRLSTQIPDSLKSFNINMEYSIFNKPIKDLYEFSPLPSAQLVSSGDNKNPFVYARLGIGVPVNPELEIKIQPRLGEKNALLITASHSSYLGKHQTNIYSGTSIKDGDFEIDAENMNNDIALLYGRFWSKGEVKINMGYRRDYYTYYGINENLVSDLHLRNANSTFNINDVDEQSYMRDSLSHTYDQLYAGISLNSSNNEPGSFYYRFGANVSYINDHPKLFKELSVPKFEEKLVSISATLSPVYGEKHKFFLSMDYKGANAIFSNVLDRGNIELYPHYRSSYKFIDFEAGVKYNHYFSENSDSSRSDFYIKADVSAELIKEHLWLYGGIDGGNIFRTWQMYMNENPWLSPFTQIKSSNIPYTAQIGIKSRFAGQIEFKLSAGISMLESSPYYTGSPEEDASNPLHSLLIANYQDYTKSWIRPEFTWKSEEIYAGASATFKSLKADSGSIVFDESKSELDAFIRYNYRERVIAALSARICGKRDVFSAGNTITLPAYNKINLNVTYVYDKNLSFYGGVDNLFNTNEYKFLYYKQLGTTIRAGICLKF